MQAPTTSADHRGSAPPGGSSYGSNLGRATIVVPKADGDDSNGVPEFLRKRLRPTPNKRHSAGPMGGGRGGAESAPIDMMIARLPESEGDRRQLCPRGG